MRKTIWNGNVSRYAMRRPSVPTLSARDRISVMEYRASKGDSDAIAWMKAYSDAKQGRWS
jgi:hypothetical protein